MTQTPGTGAGSWYDPLFDEKGQLRTRVGYNAANKFALQVYNPDGTRRPQYRPIWRPAAEAESGKLPPPSAAAAAAGGGPLDGSMRAMAIGEPLPIVFCRRRYNPEVNTIPGAMAQGGVLLTPPATEARFENTAGGIEASYHCVLGDGQMGDVQVRDVRRGSCRVGDFSQNYGTRAGTWAPGIYGTPPAGTTAPEYPNFTGGGGTYQGVSTIEFRGSCPYGQDAWRTQWNVFVREGLIIQRGRLLDGVVGASDNIADLVLYALQSSQRVPDDLIDLGSFLAAAQFTEINNMWFNGEIKEAANLLDYLTRILPHFLLRLTRKAGKFALRPLIQVTNGLMDSGPVAPAMVISEPHIVPDSFEITYSEAASRKPTTLQIIWRQQQLDDDVPLARTLEVGLASGGPFEQHDLSGFCTNELHAGRAGAYIHSRRYLSTHTATVKLRPGGQSGILAEGDIVRVQLDLNPSREVRAQFVETYQVESIGRSWSGEETLSLTHFPLFGAGGSLITAAVASVTVPGEILPTQRSAVNCDLPGRAGNGNVPSKSTSGTALPTGAHGVILLDRSGQQLPRIWPGTGLPSLPAGPTYLPVEIVTSSATYNPVVQASNEIVSRSLSVAGLASPVTKVTLSVTFTKCDDSISSTGVCLGLGEPFYDEMGLRLTSPTGVVVVLIAPSITFTVGGVAPGRTSTFVFDDDAAAPVSASMSAGGIVSSGTYRPQNPLSAFNGINGNGSWTISIEDGGRRDPLSLNNWTLSVVGGQIP